MGIVSFLDQVRLSSVSQKREKLAQPQLNLHRLKLKQLLDEEERATLY